MFSKDQHKNLYDAAYGRIIKTFDQQDNELNQKLASLAVDAAIVVLEEYENRKLSKQ